MIRSTGVILRRLQQSVQIKFLMGDIYSWLTLFGVDLLDPNHPENMNTDRDVEPTRIKRRFLFQSVPNSNANEKNGTEIGMAKATHSQII